MLNVAAKDGCLTMNGVINPDDVEKKILLILRILNNLKMPVGARLIARHMQDYGVALSERTVRYHLKMMDERSLTKINPHALQVLPSTSKIPFCFVTPAKFGLKAATQARLSAISITINNC